MKQGIFSRPKPSWFTKMFRLDKSSRSLVCCIDFTMSAIATKTILAVLIVSIKDSLLFT